MSTNITYIRNYPMVQRLSNTNGACGFNVYHYYMEIVGLHSTEKTKDEMGNG